MTHLELEEKIFAGDEKVTAAQSLVMIQCVGCRNEERNYCSRLCCSESIKNALKLKEINPNMDIYILFRDMRSYGFKEDYYREAANKGVQVHPLRARGAAQGGARQIGRGPAGPESDGYRLRAWEEAGDGCGHRRPGRSRHSRVRDEGGCRVIQGTLSPDGFFKEAHVKLRPVEFGTEGVYLCGLAHYPKFMQETINQSYGAAGRVLTLLVPRYGRRFRLGVRGGREQMHLVRGMHHALARTAR